MAHYQPIPSNSGNPIGEFCSTMQLGHACMHVRHSSTEMRSALRPPSPEPHSFSTGREARRRNYNPELILYEDGPVASICPPRTIRSSRPHSSASCRFGRGAASGASRPCACAGEGLLTHLQRALNWGGGNRSTCPKTAVPRSLRAARSDVPKGRNPDQIGLSPGRPGNT